jgi:hypothetical protein
MILLRSLNTKALSRCFVALISGAAALALSSCGDPNPLGGARRYQVKAKFVLADGKPLTSGRVTFVELKYRQNFITEVTSDGGFEFKGLGGDGLPEGEYRVVVEPLPGTAAKGSGVKAKLDLPYASKYTDEDGSDLKATVTSDESKNNFEFKMEPSSSAKPTAAPRGGN